MCFSYKYLHSFDLKWNTNKYILKDMVSLQVYISSSRTSMFNTFFTKYTVNSLKLYHLSLLREKKTKTVVCILLGILYYWKTCLSITKLIFEVYITLYFKECDKLISEGEALPRLFYQWLQKCSRGTEIYI